MERTQISLEPEQADRLRKEAEAAVEIARTTGGVQKVVRMFEYIEAPPK